MRTRQPAAIGALTRDAWMHPVGQSGGQSVSRADIRPCSPVRMSRGPDDYTSLVYVYRLYTYASI